LLPNGAIKLVERLIEVIKLQNGQLIAPLRLEDAYKSAPLVNQIIVNVNTSYNFLIAIITIDIDKLKIFASVNGLNEDID
jgi:long-subunit acyl-CoA synthetase (AMP-forming)